MNDCIIDIQTDFQFIGNLEYYYQIADRNDIDLDSMITSYATGFNDPNTSAQLRFAYHHYKKDFDVAKRWLDIIITTRLSSQSDPKEICDFWNNIKVYEETIIYRPLITKIALPCLEYFLQINDLTTVNDILGHDQSKLWPEYDKLKLRTQRLNIDYLRANNQLITAIRYAIENNLKYPEMKKDFHKLFETAVQTNNVVSSMSQLQNLYNANLKCRMLNQDQARTLAMLIAYDQYKSKNVSQVNRVLAADNISFKEFEVLLRITDLDTFLKLKLYRSLPLEEIEP
ncbi:hypothetical protein COT97_01645 [Candidatus Falkowbacteria bacterium CG10_big_fil_rev_8_21_14_0_10_39_11]|uniref:Uncharacterized protein n=1 Tax=Candidatus Falkowbacteria bacterium CG10_big_fil_rev_8_21_14_0_10_39_11 TaxID=1974565 RepID=A0A2H0V5P9_9BACT|nr:MAG: hypothetical protein COT97_01645 [Candidatus Falkowbacteria bacterium CG10_big_fil_rev_8_21_14_0_10_39_11]